MTEQTIQWRGREIPALPPGVEYNDATHRYFVDSQEWKSATQRLKPLHGFMEDGGIGMAWGKAAHDHVFHFMQGTLDAAMVDERMWPTLRGWQDAGGFFGFISKPFLAEYIVYSRRLRIIGRLDYLFDLGKHDLMVDLKTGSPSARETSITGLQLGIYAHGLIEHKLTTPAKLHTAEINVQMDGKMRPHEYNTAEIMAAAAGYLTYDSYMAKI
jgi:hypothetical protein